MGSNGSDDFMNMITMTELVIYDRIENQIAGKTSISV